MRRIISVLLTLAMLFSCGIVAMAEETVAAPAVGVEEIDFLARLGIMDAEVDPQATITRSEMAKIIMMCIGQGADVAPTATPFTDVNRSNEYSGYIQLANSANIMIGNGDGTFNPNGAVTYNQVVKLLIHAIGHEAYALSSGGYPGGYLITASNIEMLVGTTPSGEEAISHGVAAILIKNALNIDIYERVSYGNSYEYVSKAGVTALTKYFDVYQFQGIITANHDASIAGTTVLKEDEVLVDGVTTLKIGETDANQYLGYRMNLYVKVDDDARYNTIVAAYPQDNATTVLDGEDVMNNTTESLLVYLNETGEEKEIKIDSNADMIYNGSNKFWSAADLKNNFGDITAIDNDCDGDADVLIVYNYKNVIVQKIRVSDNIVYTKDETNPEWQSLEIDPESRSVKTTFVNTNGEAVSIEDLEEWNVLSVAKSDDGTVMNVILNTSSITGRVGAFDDDTITIDNEVYKYDTTKVAALSQTDFDREATFYLDFAGRVATIDFDGATSGMKYGYLRAVAVSGTGFNRKAEIEMLVDTGIKIFEFTKEVKFNGSTVSSETVVTDSRIQNRGGVIKQLIMYALDDEGKVSKLNTVTDDTENTLAQNVKDDTFTLDALLTSNDSYYYGSTNLRYFQMKYLIRTRTKVFMVQDPLEAIDDKDVYKVVSPESVPSGNWGKVQVYDVDSDRIAGAVVLYYTKGKSASTTTAVVTGITQALNKEGDPVKKFKIYNQTGASITLEIKEDVKVMTHPATNANDPALIDSNGSYRTLAVDDIKVGDVIHYMTDNITKKVEQIRLVARIGSLVQKETNFSIGTGVVDAGPNASGQYLGYGIIDDIIKDGVVYTTFNTGTDPYTEIERLGMITTATKVLHYDTTKQELTKITKDDLMVGEDVILYRYSANTYFVISID